MERNTKEIISLDEVKQLVDNFYGKVRGDEMLAPIFNGIIENRWPEHLEKMYRFWQTVLLEEHTYYGSPFRPHASMPLHANHFERWIALFNETIDESFEGERATEAKWRAGKMAQMFHHKIEHYRSHPSKTVL